MSQLHSDLGVDSATVAGLEHYLRVVVLRSEPPSGLSRRSCRDLGLRGFRVGMWCRFVRSEPASVALSLARAPPGAGSLLGRRSAGAARSRGSRLPPHSRSVSLRGSLAVVLPGPEPSTATSVSRPVVLVGTVRSCGPGSGSTPIVDATHLSDTDTDRTVSAGVLVTGPLIPALSPGDEVEIDASGLRRLDRRPGADCSRHARTRGGRRRWRLATGVRARGGRGIGGRRCCERSGVADRGGRPRAGRTGTGAAARYRVRHPSAAERRCPDAAAGRRD